ncbi:DNA polymerase I [Anaerotignum lactatifermentans]|uniref:DNA polymerase I n=1 Tax=Anaerotignum lactatifermentans TaxID=160404 RepID=A0ABS2GB75_9FIRM|nr:DNA polymerase I [Anaerotignum lactatifermentans]MBM6830198.1 DNA polymerase I [Anaerotignum lactatifermentans]MBM6878729.1 DNA polymerase I [Anaerotignum lactatifermentans]MBM6951793.1 DNA polymerase I [Anaerotignum lactatifermentans]
MAEKIMLVDGNSIVNRAFYGVPLLTNAEGQYTNAVYGFFHILLKLMEEDRPDYLAVAFDLHAPTFRHETFAEYKGTRKGMPEELRQQMPLLKEVLRAMNVPIYEKEGFEADDLLGTLSRKAQEMGWTPILVSGDRDLLQLAEENVKVRIPKTKGGRTEVEDYFAKDVMEKYGVTPTEFIDVKALMGDASDNIPGVPGIGEKTAVKIIQQYHDLETAIAHTAEIKPKKASENLAEFQEQARLSRYLATIIRDVPVELERECGRADGIFTPEAYQWMKKLEFKSMLPRFEKEQAPSAAVESSFRKIDTKKDAKVFFDNLKKEETAYLLIQDQGAWQGMGVYQKDCGGVWLEIGGDLSEEELLGCADEFLRDKAWKKIGHEVKADVHLLYAHGYEDFSADFDTALAAYLMNPTANSYAYDDLARDFLAEACPSYEEVLGKGKSKKALSDLSMEERRDFCAKQAEVCFRAKAVLQQKLEENQQELLFYEVEMPLLYVLADMERWGMKVDRQALLAYQKTLGERVEEVSRQVYEMAGEEFNLNSPKQLGMILFKRLGLKGGKKTKTGYSTAADVLEKLRPEHPIIDKILEYRQLAKLKSTYADGLLAVLDEKTDKIYSTFHQTITATGRISSTEPNLQNIPIRLELGRELRKVFIPSSPEFCFLDADYSQIELRVLAHIAGDETLIEAFRQKQDIHRLTASQVFHVPFDEVTSLQRSNAKAVNFGIVYGIGAFSLSQDLGITRKEAENYIQQYFLKYPKIKEYLDRTVKEAEENGYVSTILNRRRAMPELQSKNFVQHAFGERVAMNMPIQGSAADIIKIAMIQVHRALKEGGFRSRLILQVHDELLIETAMEEKEAVEKILKEKMEQAVTLSVPLDVDVHEGNTWFEAK